MSDERYDVVIIGAGIAGSILGRQLGENGKRVLILEAGPGTGLDQGGFRSFVNRFYLQQIKTPDSPFPHSVNAPVEGQPFGYYIQKGPQPYGSNYTRHAGGTTLHWMGTSLRFLPEDFRLRSKYGQGIDWPLSYEDLQPYYQMAEWEFGVAANVAEQEQLDPTVRLFAPGYDYPMEKVPQSYLDKVLDRRIEGLKVSVGGDKYALRVVSTPAARNSTPRKAVDPRDPRRRERYYRPVGAPDDPDEQGQRCEGNSSCIPICPVQAKYSALKTLRNAIDNNTSQVEVLTQAVASQIEIDTLSGRVDGIRYKKYHDPAKSDATEHVARGTIYVVAAHAIETAKLLLASHAANSSDMVGRCLMDHPFVITWGLMPEPVGSYRGPGSTSGIPQLRDGEFRRNSAAFRVEIGNWGVSFPNGTPYSTIQALVDRQRFRRGPERRRRHKNDLFGDVLRREIAEIGPRQFRLGFEFEQLPELNNRVTIDARYRDAIGNFRPVIAYRVDDYCRSGIAAAKRVSDKIFKKIDATDETEYDPEARGYFEIGSKGYEYHGAGHAAGTHRMGSSPKDSVVNPDQQTWDHNNLYLVGCGNFCTIGTANPTLTAAALAFKAAEKIIRELS